jgi:hypothetical protein
MSAVISKFAADGLKCSARLGVMSSYIKHDDQSQLALIERDPAYGCLRAGVHSAMLKRAQDRTTEIRSATNANAKRSQVAIAFRGSYACGHPTVFSDIDIVTISQRVKETDLPHCNALKLPHQLPVSVVHHSVEDLSCESSSLTFWLSIPQLRFVSGAKAVFRTFLTEALDILRRIDLPTLVDMFERDPFRRYCSDPDSPHYYNIKRGMGGTIEHDFVQLIRRWKELQVGRIDQHDVQQLRTLNRYYTYLTILKDHLHCRYRCPLEARRGFPEPHGGFEPWFFATDITQLVAVEQYDHVVQFLNAVSTCLSAPQFRRLSPQEQPVSFQIQTTKAFWSYTHFDNEHDQDRLSWLSKRLAGEITVRTGIAFQIFIDTSDLRTGQDWRFEIEDALNDAEVLFVIMTPSYFSSASCRKEYEHFRDRERDLGRNDLIIPIYYLDAEPIERQDVIGASPWASELKDRQYFDWRDLRLKQKESPLIRKALSRLALHVVAVLKDLRSSRLESVHAIPTSRLESTLAPDTIARVYGDLSGTQKQIMTCVYKEYRDNQRSEIVLDELFALFCRRYGTEPVCNASELYYRVLDLSRKGLVSHKSRRGEKRTVVMPLDAVAVALSERNKMNT